MITFVTVFLVPSVISVNMFMIRPLALKLHQLPRASLAPEFPTLSQAFESFGIATDWMIALPPKLPSVPFLSFLAAWPHFFLLLLNYSISPLLLGPTSIAPHFLPAAAKSKSAAALIWHLWLIFGTILHILNDSNVRCHYNFMQGFIRMEPINSL